MKQRVLIIILILLIVIVSGIWVYMLFFAQKGGAGVFSNFFSSENPPTFTETTEPDPTTDSFDADTDQDVGSDLRKLTDKRAADATFIEDTIRFVERGTGYIYDIDVVRGNIEQVTRTTVPRVVDAVFAPKGDRVVLISEEQGSRTAVLGLIDVESSSGGSIETTPLPEGAGDFHFNTDGTLLYYTVSSTEGTTGYVYDIVSQTKTERFSIPLQYVEVLWGDPLYIYTTPSAYQVGHLYKMSGNDLLYVTPGATGLTAKRFLNNLLLISTRDEDAIKTQIVHNSDLSDFPLRAFLEKCVSDSRATSTLYCGAPNTIPSGIYPDDWYKGVVTFSDSLWSYNTLDGIHRISNISSIAQTPIDISDIYINTSGEYLSFINKNDDSLWLYTLEK